MTEQILAYSAQNSYAQGEGRFTMPGSEPGEGLRPNVGHKQINRQELHREAPRREENQDTKPKEPLFKPLNRVENEMPVIPFATAEPVIRIINQLQNISEKEEKGEQVVVPREDIGKVRMLIENFGDEDDARRQYTPAEAIVYAQEVLRNSVITVPDLKELGINEDFARAAGVELILKRGIFKAQGRNYDTGEEEEKLSLEKVKKYLKVADVKPVAGEKSGKPNIDGSLRVTDLFLAENVEPTAPQGFEIVHQTKIPIGVDGELPVLIYRRNKDGRFVMNRLPSDRYTKDNVKLLLEEAKIAEDADLPDDFDGKTADEKVEYLKDRFKLDTLESGLNVMAQPQQIPLDEIPFKVLLNEKWRISLLNQPTQIGYALPQIQQEINRRVHSQDPEDILPSLRDMREMQNMVAHDPGMQAALNQVIGVAQQQELILAKQAMDDKYEILMNDLFASGRGGMLADIDRGKRVALSALNAGYRDIGQVERDFKNELDPSRNVEIPGYEGLRAWYTYKSMEQVLTTLAVLERFEVQADPFENIDIAEETMRFFERSESVENFGLARENLTRLLRAVEQSNDQSLTELHKQTLRDHIQAFMIITPMWITYKRGEGEPEEFGRAAKDLGDEMFGHYFDRFRQGTDVGQVRDKEGRLYFVDAQGNELDINIFGEAVNAMRFKLMWDKYRSNQVSELTKRDLDIHTVDVDEQWIIKNILGLPQNQPMPALTNAQVNTLRATWNDKEGKVNSVKEWYRTNTYLGVDGFEENSMRTLREVREEEIADTVLRDRLLAAGVDQARIDDLLGNQGLGGDRGLMKAVMANAVNYVNYELIPTLDRLRVYDKKGEQIGNVHNEDNPFVAYEVDHMPDYFLSEGHGDVRVNEITRKMLNKNWRSFSIASNNSSFRLFNNMKPYWTPQMSNVIAGEINAEIARLGPLDDWDRKTEVEAYVFMDVVSRGYNPNAPAGNQVDIFNVDMAQASKKIDNYVVTDNAGDRTKVLEWYRKHFREFSKRPSEENAINTLLNYYSGRPIRIEQGAEFIAELYQETNKHGKEWFGFEDNISTNQMENLLQKFEEKNILSKKRTEVLKDKLVGRPVPRNTKELWEYLVASFKSTALRPGYWGSSLWDFFKTLVAYLGSSR